MSPLGYAAHLGQNFLWASRTWWSKQPNHVAPRFGMHRRDPETSTHPYPSSPFRSLSLSSSSSSTDHHLPRSPDFPIQKPLVLQEDEGQSRSWCHNLSLCRHRQSLSRFVLKTRSASVPSRLNRHAVTGVPGNQLLAPGIRNHPGLSLVGSRVSLSKCGVRSLSS